MARAPGRRKNENPCRARSEMPIGRGRGAPVHQEAAGVEGGYDNWFPRGVCKELREKAGAAGWQRAVGWDVAKSSPRAVSITWGVGIVPNRATAPGQGPWSCPRQKVLVGRGLGAARPVRPALGTGLACTTGLPG